MPPWKKSFYAIFAAELLAIAGFGTSTPILPFFLQDLGVTDPDALKFWVGVINSAASLSLAVLAPVWGKLADSYGRRPMLLRSMYGGALVIFLIGFAASPQQVFVLRFLQGAVTGTVAAATVLVAGIVPEEEVGFRMGILQTAIFVGNSLGPFLGGLMADLFGNRVTFFATSVLLLAAGIIVQVFVKETFLPLRPEKFHIKNFIPDIRPLYESRAILVLVVLAGLIQVANSIVSPILPLHIQGLVGGAAKVGSITGIIIGVSALASAFSAAFMGRVSFRLGYGKILLLGFAASALFHIPQGLVGTPLLLLVFRTLGAFCLGMAVPVINALIAGRAAKDRQGSIYGLASSMNSLGFGMGPMIGAGVALMAGFPAVFFAAALILAGSAYVTKRYVLSEKPASGPVPETEAQEG